MSEDERAKLQEAFETILSVIPSLTEFQWKLLVSRIDAVYRRRASKVVLTDSELETVRCDIKNYF